VASLMDIRASLFRYYTKGKEVEMGLVLWNVCDKVIWQMFEVRRKDGADIECCHLELLKIVL
jgi:hypothetical protein